MSSACPLYGRCRLYYRYVYYRYDCGSGAGCSMCVSWMLLHPPVRSPYISLRSAGGRRISIPSSAATSQDLLAGHQAWWSAVQGVLRGLVGVAIG